MPEAMKVFTIHWNDLGTKPERYLERRVVELTGLGFEIELNGIRYGVAQDRDSIRVVKLRPCENQTIIIEPSDHGAFRFR
jgi:hypothetical protein